MTKKDYIKFAEMIVKGKINCNTYYDYDMGYLTAMNDIQADMIHLFRDDNPSFDADRFNAYIDKRVKELTENG